MLSIKDTAMNAKNTAKKHWWQSKNTTGFGEEGKPAGEPVNSEPSRGRWSRGSDAVLNVAGKVTLLLILVAASVSSVEKTKNSYNNL
jgi:hypothetical protein